MIIEHVQVFSAKANATIDYHQPFDLNKGLIVELLQKCCFPGAATNLMLVAAPTIANPKLVASLASTIAGLNLFRCIARRRICLLNMFKFSMSKRTQTLLIINHST